jgi:hypothetical protein
MWFCPVNEMTGLVLAYSTSNQGRIFVSERMRAGSRYERFRAFARLKTPIKENNNNNNNNNDNKIKIIKKRES